MFFGLCIYETLNEVGLLDSIIISPVNSFLVVDKLVDVGAKIDTGVDIGSLRFYTDEEQLKVNTAKSILRPPMFESTNDSIRFKIEHSHLPLKQSHAGYYLLLLPKNYGGDIKCSGEYPEIFWLEDSKQILISFTVYPEKPNVKVTGFLRKSTGPSSDMKISTLKETFKSDLPGVHYRPVSSLLKAIQHNLSTGAPSDFICHSSENKPDARRLAIELAARGIKPWIDEAEIRIGDSLFAKIEEGVMNSTCLVPILSKASVNSAWCKEELRMALALQLSKKVKRVLPALIEECEVPGFLLEKVYVDLKEWSTYNEKVDKLAEDIKQLGNFNNSSQDVPVKLENPKTESPINENGDRSQIATLSSKNKPWWKFW